MALWLLIGRWSIEVTGSSLRYFKALGRNLRFHEATYPLHLISNVRLEPRTRRYRGSHLTVYLLAFDYEGHVVQLAPTFEFYEGRFLLNAQPLNRHTGA